MLESTDRNYGRAERSLDQNEVYDYMATPDLMEVLMRSEVYRLPGKFCVLFVKHSIRSTEKN
jgi:hypothetical protein